MLHRDTMCWKKWTFTIRNELTKIEKVLYIIYNENYKKYEDNKAIFDFNENYKKLEIEGKSGWQSDF